jgi:D-alanyl-D-alanine carboxypeptidase/D-alanyl-D-alanine-endopeptidase (penicillin-binding protein 4)
MSVGVAHLLVVISVILFGQSASAGCPSFSDVIVNGTYGVSDQQGRLLGSCNIDTPFIPASIIKIPTALAALHVLGADYRFKTEFYRDSELNLYIRGFGDPLLISEEVFRILKTLHEKGVREVHDIFIDDSSFALEHQPPGRGTSTNPYDAPVGATVVNFNSVSIRVDKRHHTRSAESQTPTLPIMKQLGQRRKAGRYLINICRKNCEPEKRMARFTAELFRAQMEMIGIKVSGTYGRKSVPLNAPLLYVYKNSRNLSEVLASMLKYSSNFIANLVYLTVGAQKYGYPATWDKADRAVHETLVQAVGEKTASLIVQVEGSGLSRNNQVTGRAMLQVLQKFTPHAHLLRKRRQVLIKTGTMKGIYNYAGYLRDGKPFVVMLNQKANTRSTVLDRLAMGRYLKIQ